MLATGTTLLCGIARVNPYYLAPGTFSLECKYQDKRYPPSIINALCKIAMHHSTDRKILNNDNSIPICVMLCGLEVKVLALALNIQVRLCKVLYRLAPVTTSLYAPTYDPLLAPKCGLTLAIVARVFHHATIAICQEHL
jgi:hypothetical protein